MGGDGAHGQVGQAVDVAQPMAGEEKRGRRRLEEKRGRRRLEERSL